MNLHENKEVLQNAIRAASDHFNIREIFVEKDYWVTFILKRLSQSDNRDKVVFKGGTSLSKVFKLIGRCMLRGSMSGSVPTTENIR